MAALQGLIQVIHFSSFEPTGGGCTCLLISQ